MAPRRKLTPRQARELANDLVNGMTVAKAVEKYKISRGSVYYYRRDHEYGRDSIPRILLPCGTDAAYARHLRKKEKPCLDCYEAHALEMQRRRRLMEKKKENKSA